MRYHATGGRGFGGLRITTGMAGLFFIWSLSTPAWALEFGPLVVRSSLNEPLQATFTVNRLDQADQLSIGMASSERFEQLGIPRIALIDQLRLSAVKTDSGTARVRITSSGPVDEPFVSFVVRADAGGASSLHEYTVFLDPAGASGNTASRRDTMASSMPSRATTSRASSRRYDRGADDMGSRSYRVRPGDTLSALGQRFQPAGASAAQTAWAIYQANGSAFGDGPSTLLSGARLTVPDAETIRSTSSTRADRALGASAARQAARSQQTARPATASGETPPDPAALNNGANNGTTANTNPTSTSAVAAVQPRDADFGTLMSGIDAPWPSEEASLSRPAPASPEAVSGEPSGMMTSQGNPMASAEPERPRRNYDLGTSDTGDTSADTPNTQPVSSPTPSTASNTSSAGPGLFRTRNLVLGLALFLLVMIWLRQREQKQKTEKEETPERPNGRPGRAGAAGAAASATQSRQRSTAARPAASRPRTSAGAEPAWLATPPTASTRSEAPRERPASGPADTPSRTPDVAPAPAEPRSEPVSDSPGRDADHKPSADTDAEPDEKPRTAASPESKPAAQSTSPTKPQELAFQPSEIETVERRHDQGQSDDALAFEFDDTLETSNDTDASQTPAGKRDEPVTDSRTAPSARSESHATPAAVGEQKTNGSLDKDEAEHPNDWYTAAGTQESENPDDWYTAAQSGARTSMIDPDEFDLYDTDASTSDEANDPDEDSIAIRLDLARMYVGMDDTESARELLEDVSRRGDAEQKRDARALLEEMDGAGRA